MHKRSRTPDLVSPSQRSSSRTHSDRSTAHPIAQMKHPVALNNYVWAFQQMLRVDGVEVTLTGPEHDGCDVHAYLVDPTCGERLAADVASSELDSAVTRKLPRLGHGRLDAVDKVERRLEVPAPGRTTVTHHDHMVDPTRRRPIPAVGDVEGVTAGNGHPDLVPVRPDVVERSLRHLQNATVVQRHVTADEPLEDRTGIVVLSRDETIHRNRPVHDHFPHGFLLCLQSQVLCGVSCRSCTKSIGWERPAVQDVVGMIAQESPPDFGVPGRREPGELPELAHEVGLVEVARASGNVSPVDRCSVVERQHGGAEAVAASQPFWRDTDYGLEPLRHIRAAGAGRHTDVAERPVPPVAATALLIWRTRSRPSITPSRRTSS